MLACLARTTLLLAAQASSLVEAKDDSDSSFWAALSTVLVICGLFWLLGKVMPAETKKRKSPRPSRAPSRASRAPTGVRTQPPTRVRTEAPMRVQTYQPAPAAYDPTLDSPPSSRVQRVTQAQQALRAQEAARTQNTNRAWDPSAPQVTQLHEVTPGQSEHEYNLGDASGRRGFVPGKVA